MSLAQPRPHRLLFRRRAWNQVIPAVEIFVTIFSILWNETFVSFLSSTVLGCCTRFSLRLRFCLFYQLLTCSLSVSASLSCAGALGAWPGDPGGCPLVLSAGVWPHVLGAGLASVGAGLSAFKASLPPRPSAHANGCCQFGGSWCWRKMGSG